MKDIFNPDQISRIKQRQEEYRERPLSIEKEWQGRRGFQWLDNTSAKFSAPNINTKRG